MTVLVTGAAGFIGFHLSHKLLTEGDDVIGVDNLNDYYDVGLKQARLDQLQAFDRFSFRQVDISDRDAIFALRDEFPNVTHIVHLAAQAGVRYSLINPYQYVQSNIMGEVVMLEFAKLCSELEHFVYASSSSVYGSNTKVPFSVEDPVDQPVSLYGATKRSDELIAHTYAHLYQMPITGLRFFTVYGPWGRPDMAAYIFTRQILAGEPVRMFNYGKMMRDFTYIDDIVSGTLAAMRTPPPVEDGTTSHRVFNLGNNKPQDLRHFIAVIEELLDVKADVRPEPIQPGDVPATFADIDTAREILGYQPTTDIETGLRHFIDWYREYHGA